MPHLPLGTEGSYARVRGIMLFPGNSAKEQESAEAVAAKILAGGSKIAADAAEHFPDEIFRMIVRMDAGTVLDARDLKKRHADGFTVGELVKVYFGLARQYPELASWQNAIHCLEKARGTSSGSTFKEAKKRMLPAAHLWGAWVIRGQQLHPQPEKGFTNHDDFETFIEEAQTLLDWGSKWQQKHATEKSPFPSDKMWQAPENWQRNRWELGWPTIWDNLEYELSEVVYSDLLKKREHGDAT